MGQGSSPLEGTHEEPCRPVAPEIARQIHPDWRKNEAAYWAARDRLLAQFQGQWVGFADGAVIASARAPWRSSTRPKLPAVTRVDHEDEPIRMRRASFPYDGA